MAEDRPETKAPAAASVDGTTHWFTARKGAQLAYYQPNGVLEGIIEAHPDYPPVVHWVDGRDEELKCTADGVPIINTVSPFGKVEIGVGNPDDYPYEGTITFVDIADPKDFSSS